MQTPDPDMKAMSGTGPRMLFFMGAPLSSTLQWADDQLVTTLEPCFLDNCTPQSLPFERLRPAWRSLSSKPAHLPTGCTPRIGRHESLHDSYDGEDETSFFTTTDISFLSEASSELTASPHTSIDRSLMDDEDLTQFYEHSLAVHDDFIASEMELVPENDDSQSSSVDLENSIMDTLYESQWRSNTVCQYNTLCPDNLKDIPKASHLLSIAPQTVSVNVVVGVISIEPTRIIRTRRDGRMLELVELIVGDETKAGFGITIWLSSDKEKVKNIAVQDIRSEVGQLRPQDIILVKNVALSSFRGKVHGQSLRKDLTRILLLHRNKVDANDRQGVYSARDLQKQFLESSEPLRSKTRKVKGWVMGFVGTTRKRMEIDGKRACLHHQLPLDTQ